MICPFFETHPSEARPNEQIGFSRSPPAFQPARAGAGNGWNQVDQTALGSPVQNPDRTSYRDSKAARFLDPFAVVHENQVRLQVQGQEDRVVLAAVQIGQGCGIRPGNHRNDLEPRGPVRNPMTYWIRRGGLLKFGYHGFRNEHIGVKSGQQLRMADQDQIADRGRVGEDNSRHGL
jgi:hypothetical protein